MQDGDTNTQTDGMRRREQEISRVDGRNGLNYLGSKGKIEAYENDHPLREFLMGTMHFI